MRHMYCTVGHRELEGVTNERRHPDIGTIYAICLERNNECKINHIFHPVIFPNRVLDGVKN